MLFLSKFIGSDLFKYLMVALAAMGLLFGAYWKGEQVVKAEWAIERLKTESEIKELKAKADQVTVKVESKYIERIKYIKIKGDTIVEQVPVYVTNEDSAKCSINNGFIRVWNSAIQNNIPGPTTEADREPSGVSLTQVATNAATNFSICNQYREQAEGLKEWIREQQKVK